ncbi:MAG: J domain-containing protein [Microscillaceae bacterium]|jgi:hypothetical protein|nr:J domain-containing protein [Microscillaceae bacterium]
MLVDRFIEFLKIEWNDWAGVYDEKKTAQSSKTEKSLFEQFFSVFSDETHQKASPADREAAYQAYQRFRNQQQTAQQQAQQAQIRQEAKYFDALEINPTQDFDAIKTAYKKAMKKYHPDRYAGNSEKQQIAQQISQKINEAFQYFERKFQK